MCLQTIYGLNSGVFLSTPLHMPYPNQGRGLALCPECVYTPIYPVYCLLFCPPGYVPLYVAYYQPISAYGRFFPPEGMRIGIRKRLESPCTCSYIRSSLDQYLSTDTSV